jgi:hypothetical protein
MAEQENERQPPPHRKPLSRRALLMFGWARGRVNEAVGSDASGAQAAERGHSTTLIELGPVELYASLPVGDVQTPAGYRDIFVVRLREGLLALVGRCPRDGGLLSWRPRDPSEDDLSERGRFYCPRDGSVFDRYGRLAAGAAERGLGVVATSEHGGTLWVDKGQPVEGQTRDDVLGLVLPLT